MIKSVHKILQIPNSSFLIKRGFRVLFFGSDDFAHNALHRLNLNSKFSYGCEKVIDELAVANLSTNEKSPVKKYAEAHDIKQYIYPEFPKDYYDIGVVVSFGKLIPENIINSFPNGMINMHPSLLPHLRGPSPIGTAILLLDQTTGVSIMKINPGKFDQGEILSQTSKILIKNSYTSRDLGKVLVDYGSDLLLETLQNFDHRLKNATPQLDLGNPTISKKFTSTHFDLEFSSASEIILHYRAYGHGTFNKISTTLFDEKFILKHAEIPRPEEMQHWQNHRRLVQQAINYSIEFKSLFLNTTTIPIIVKALALPQGHTITAEKYFNKYMEPKGYEALENLKRQKKLKQAQRPRILVDKEPYNFDEHEKLLKNKNQCN